MKHANIAIFVPHLGCPHQCAFCNQRHITGFSVEPSATDVYEAVRIAFASGQNTQNCEIAFFGGSFTAIERNYMLELLTAASNCIKEHKLYGIRISTRPDCINEEILEILKKYHVTSIELGAQSMSDDVLHSNERGHTSNSVIKASKLIKSYGFELGLQMMTGLYKSNFELDRFTARQIIELKPTTVRIYPTITLKNTTLEELYLCGKYIPYSLSESVELCTDLLQMFENAGISVIRLGLHSIDKESYVAGPWHPAFRELCDAMRFRNIIEKNIVKNGNYIVKVNPADVSKVLGQKRSNIDYFKDKKVNLKILQEKTVCKNTVLVEEVK